MPESIPPLFAGGADCAVAGGAERAAGAARAAGFLAGAGGAAFLLLPNNPPPLLPPPPRRERYIMEREMEMQHGEKNIRSGMVDSTCNWPLQINSPPF